MFVYGANVPGGSANAASTARPRSANCRKTERDEKKNDGVTTKKPTPDELKRIEAATKIRFPRSSRDSTMSPRGSVTFSGVADFAFIGRMLATTSSSFFTVL